MSIKETSYIECPSCGISFYGDDFYKDIKMIGYFMENVRNKCTDEEFDIFKGVINDALEEYEVLSNLE